MSRPHTSMTQRRVSRRREDMCEWLTGGKPYDVAAYWPQVEAGQPPIVLPCKRWALVEMFCHWCRRVSGGLGVGHDERAMDKVDRNRPMGTSTLPLPLYQQMQQRTVVRHNDIHSEYAIRHRCAVSDTNGYCYQGEHKTVILTCRSGLGVSGTGPYSRLADIEVLFMFQRSRVLQSVASLRQTRQYGRH